MSSNANVGIGLGGMTPPTSTIPVSIIKMHEEYNLNGGAANDIAVLGLSNSVNFDDG